MTTSEEFLADECALIKNFNPKFRQEFAAVKRCWLPGLGKLQVSEMERALRKELSCSNLTISSLPPDWEYVAHDPDDDHAPTLEEIAAARSAHRSNREG
ncbi:hypothetical protein [Paracoccus sp. SY]|uniref:hypothetical protein n=1 Tax=Paracoccus sp. SY TaxID=1330255 RepID=UPI0011AF15F4|nr:hypothetical protein [Paracoccus sp. SY]